MINREKRSADTVSSKFLVKTSNLIDLCWFYSKHTMKEVRGVVQLQRALLEASDLAVEKPKDTEQLRALVKLTHQTFTVLGLDREM